jgi:Txe/YoeB family toxin of Txe-Axe toxin-antitoxin module
MNTLTIVSFYLLLILFIGAAVYYIVKKQKLEEHFITDSPVVDSKPTSKVDSETSLITNFLGTSYINTNTTTDAAINKQCRVYYTPFVNECDKGVFNMNDSELAQYYGDETTKYNTIKDAMTRLPEPGICKITLQNWKSGSNAPVLNFTDRTNVNRGNPESWAYCFREVSNEDEFGQMTKDYQTNKTLQLNSTSLPNVFNDGLSYARLAFKNFVYTDVKKDVCLNINQHEQQTDVYNLIGLTIDSSYTIRDYGIYNYSDQKLILEDANNVKEQEFEKFFEENLQEDRRRPGYEILMLQPKNTNATLYKFETDACGYTNVQGSIPGIISLSDFGIEEKMLMPPSKKTDDLYGTSEDLNNKIQELSIELETLTTKRETMKTPREQKITDKRMNRLSRRIDRINRAILMVEENKKKIIQRHMFTILGQNVPYKNDTDGTEGNGIPPIYRSNDNRIYILVI